MDVESSSPASKLIEIGTLLGQEHAQDRERFRTHWEEHIHNSRNMILQGADRVKEPESVTILGGAAAYNIPVEELAQRFDRVRLVDIDRDGLQQTVDSLSVDCRSKVEIVVADTTGGVAARLLGLGLEIIQNATTSEEGLTRLVPLFQGNGLDMTPDAGPIDDWKASYVVSSGLSSQLTIFPEKCVLNAFHEKFGTELESDFLFTRGSFLLRNTWVRQHGEFLATLMAPKGRVYWADTVAETPYLSEFGDAPLAAIVEAVTTFLDGTYLKTFLTEPGKQILAERFAEGLPGRHPQGRRLQGDELLQAYQDQLHPELKRRFAWAIMTLAGENLITPRRELELIKYIIREAEGKFTTARQPMLDGGKLSSFFPDSLVPDGDMASWLWINDPEGAVTLNGYSYYVDSHVLKKKQ